MTNRFVSIGWLLMLLLCPASLLLADNHKGKSPAFSTVEVTANIKMFQGKGGNANRSKNYEG